MVEEWRKGLEMRLAKARSETEDRSKGAVSMEKAKRKKTGNEGIKSLARARRNLAR